MILRSFLADLARFGRDQRGSMMIETAVVIPVLAILALGGFEASSIVARQTELQSAAAEAAAIVRAAKPDTAAKRTTIRDVIATSTGIEAQNIAVTQIYRCGTGSNYITNDSSCSDPDLLSTYIKVEMTTTYTPRWTEYGVGSAITYNVDRTVLIG
ncbi:MAG: pilus assembly protein [Sphingomonadaceae bacterium]|nr:pilus assembly protein [Sphingomonadaceae bacterium]